jgi:hypothetical protein
MASATRPPSVFVYRGRIAEIVRQPEAIDCLVAKRGHIRLPLLLASYIAIGDEITFPIPVGDAIGAEICITRTASPEGRPCVYLAPVEYVTQPKRDKRDLSFVAAQIRAGNLGISSILLPCETLRDYFYCIPTSQGGPTRPNLYDALRIATGASPAEIRIAFKLRELELRTIGAARAEHVKLERAFNILGHPELRAHYDSLLCDPELPAIFPYGAVGSLLVAGERSRNGDTFFTASILAFVPDRTHRRFHLPVRNCEFYSDRALCRDVRRKLQFWLDPALLHVSWDPSWNRWKHLFCSKVEVDGTFVRSSGYKKRGEGWEFAHWEVGLPSRLWVKLPTDFKQDIEKAQNTYCRFGRYSRALDQIRRCLEHKAIERKDLERICSELGIPNDFDIAQISWRPDYDSFFYRELSRRARRIYLFRDEYIFDLEKAVVVETPQLGHATYVFTKPRDMDNFLARYTKTTKTGIRRNQDNVAERLGFPGPARAWHESYGVAKRD